MSRIIVPGAEKEKRDDPRARPEDIIMAMMEDARKKGMDFREYLAENFRQWNEEDILWEFYQDFLRDVEAGEPKAFPNDTGAYWNENSTFEEYIYQAKLVTLMRLEQLEQLKRERTPSFQHLAKLQGEAEKAGVKDFELTIDGVGEPPPNIALELYEEVLRRNLEVFNKFLSGKLKVPHSPSWGKLDYPEEQEMKVLPIEEFKK